MDTALTLANQPCHAREGRLLWKRGHDHRLIERFCIPASRTRLGTHTLDASRSMVAVALTTLWVIDSYVSIGKLLSRLQRLVRNRSNRCIANTV